MKFHDVYCDMDGVLADFITPACKFFGLNEPDVRQVSSPFKTPKDKVIFNELWPTEQGWPVLKKEWPTFWADLDLMPYALDLWRIIDGFHPSLLSAIPNGWETAGVGKTIWAKKHLPNFGAYPGQQVVACERSEKVKYAVTNNTPNVLIDDFDKNIQEWNEAGGLGIQYRPNLASLNNVEKIILGVK